MKTEILRKYAELIVRVGANVRPGQTVLLFSSVETYPFTSMVAEACYKAGAARVDLEWSCMAVRKLGYDYCSLETLSTVLKWEKEKLKLMAEELPCRIFIFSDDPNGLQGADQEKMQKSRIARYPVIKPYRDAIENRHQWTIAAAPSAAWAKTVFPDLDEDAAIEKLWEAILSAVRVTEDNDPVEAWRLHNERLAARSRWLNEHRFEMLEYKSESGTDFRVWLMPEGRWCGGGETTLQGVYFNPNLPTEEIFTTPKKGRAEGTLVATKPLSYEGQLIENFRLTFKDGSAVSCAAEKGQPLLEKMLAMDEGASMLGEAALIPCDSPINNSGLLFYETLFDENASCHFALGFGFNDAIEGYEKKTNEECKALGVNESMIHVDFMIGAPDLDVTGYKDGVAVPIFRHGEWAFTV